MSTGVLGLCLALWTGPGATQAAMDGTTPAARAAELATDRFTLVWTHSIEKVRWEEDYRVEQQADAAVLRPLTARIKGSGAGMEPPDHARLVDGWYRYQPDPTALPQLLLSRSAYTADYQLCTKAGCQPLAHWLGDGEGTATVRACPLSGKNAPDEGLKPPPASGNSD